MLGADPAIDLRSALSARAFQAVFPLLFRLVFSSPELQFATKQIAEPETIALPTRRGTLRALLYKPTGPDIAEAEAAARKPPVHLIAHGGAFIIQVPEQEDNVARFLASEVNAYVVVPDFDTAPTVRHPVTEHEAYDAFVWVRENAGRHGWDGDRLSVGGPSAGGQAALGVVIQALEAGSYVPVALSAEYAACDFARPDS